MGQKTQARLHMCIYLIYFSKIFFVVICGFLYNKCNLSENGINIDHRKLKKKILGRNAFAELFIFIYGIIFEC